MVAVLEVVRIEEQVTRVRRGVGRPAHDRRPRSGVITRLHDKPGDLDLLAEPRLAESFRLLLPLPDLEANYLLGRDQRLTGVEETDTGQRACVLVNVGDEPGEVPSPFGATRPGPP